MKCFSMPDGTEMYCESRTAFDVLSREFTGKDVYTRHGIELHTGDCIFDAGANVGFFTRYIALQVPNSKVFSFEPIPQTFACLERNLESTDGTRVKAFNIGISDKPGTAVFRHYPLVSVASSMYPDDSPSARKDARRYALNEIHAKHFLLSKLVDWTPTWLWWPTTEIIRRIFNRSIDVECRLRAISEIIDEENVERIDLLKIDVEGAEQAALDGITEEHWNRIRQLVIETHHGKEHATAMTAALRDRGYAVVMTPLDWYGAQSNDQPADKLFMLYARREGEVA